MHEDSVICQQRLTKMVAKLAINTKFEASHTHLNWFGFAC